MLNIVVRLLDQWAQHRDHGLMEMASTLPRQSLGGRPDDAAPPPLTFFNDADSKALLTEEGPDKVPAWVTFGDRRFLIELKGFSIAYHCFLGMAYITEDGADEVQSNRNCDYYMRGGMISLARYNSQDKSAGYRELNGIKVHQIKKVTEQRVPAAVGTRKMWGMLEIEAIVIENYQ